MPRLPKNQYDVACKLPGSAFFRVTSRKDREQTPAMVHAALKEIIERLEIAYPELKAVQP